MEAIAKTPIRAVDCGQEHTVALSIDGTVYAWGLNTQGALGVGSKVTATDSPLLLEKQSHVIQISCGSHQTFLLHQDSTVKACGNNQVGQLGINKSNSSSIFYLPTRVCIEHEISQVAAGESHTLFLTNDGEVYSVGDNSHC